MAKSKNEEPTIEGSSEDSLEGAFSGGSSDGGGVFGAWGGQQASAPAPIPAPAAVPAPAATPTALPTPSYQTEQTVTSDGRAPYRKPVGFRVSSGVARRLEKYRKDTNLTVTEVVMLMVDKSVGVLEEMVEYAVQGPKVQTSLFAPQGVAGPPKGTGSEQRQWSPRPEDVDVMKQVVEMSGLPSISVYIAVALNFCLPEKPCKKD